jgi:hypothetical protein
MQPIQLLAKGGHRHVYTTSDPLWVVKVQQLEGSYNRLEWNVWNALKDTSYSRWLAPCKEISDDGKYLVQRRGIPVPSHIALPTDIPAPLCHDYNLHRQWVIIPDWNNGQPVLCDYDHNQWRDINSFKNNQIA